MRRLGSVLKNGLPKIDAAFYGEGGTGKTTLLGQFAQDERTGPAFWVDAAGNCQILEVHGIELLGFRLDGYKDILKVVDFFQTGQSVKHPLRTELELPADLQFNSLIVDTMSHVQQRLIDYIMELYPDPNLKGTDLIQVIATKHGAKIIGTFLDLTRKILALPVHTFSTFQLYEKVNFSGGAGGEITGASVQKQLQLYGSSRVIVPPYYTLMGELTKAQGIDPATKKPGTVTVVTWRDVDKAGKNQLSRSMPEKIINPTANEILNFIENDWKKEN